MASQCLIELAACNSRCSFSIWRMVRLLLPAGQPRKEASKNQCHPFHKHLATLFTSPCKQLPSSMVAGAASGLVEPGLVPFPPPSIPPPTSSIPPPTLPRLVAQHPSRQLHSLPITQDHIHHSCRSHPTCSLHNAFPATARSVHPNPKPKSLPPATSGRQKKPMSCP